MSPRKTAGSAPNHEISGMHFKVALRAQCIRSTIPLAIYRVNVFCSYDAVQLDEQCCLKLVTFISGVVQRRIKKGDPFIEYGSPIQY